MKLSTFILIIGGCALISLILQHEWAEVVTAMLGIIGLYIQVRETEDGQK